MYIVVIVDSYYPSVLHFNERIDAIEFYERNKKEGYVVHLAEVEVSHFDEESLPYIVEEGYEQSAEYFQRNLEKLDVEWY